MISKASNTDNNQRQAGVVLHLTSLPGAYGVGDIGDTALAFIDTLSAMGIHVWQFLPTGPTAYGDSPYQPLSAFAGNELLIGLEPLIRLGLLSADDTALLAGFSGVSVDYGRLIPAKSRLLNKAADRFIRHAGAELRQQYEAFLQQHGEQWLDDYALFRILKSNHGEKPWPEWQRDYVRRAPESMVKLEQRHQREIQHIKIIQFLFDQQWQTLRRHAYAREVRLFGDTPIYIALDSADAWAQREILRIDRDGKPSHIAGVPPDYFSEDGQLWGNPLYDWDYHAATGYKWWVQRMQHSMQMSDLIRIDHFRGFESYWSVPVGSETARHGRWEPGPGDGLFSALENALGDLPIVAEDLGVITPAVEGLRRRHRIPGMRVLQFDVSDAGFHLSDIERHCVCYTGTHDNDTTLGWFQGTDDDTRSQQEISDTRENALRLTGGSAQTIHWDLIRLAFSSQAAIAIAPMQDFLGLGSEARLNTPGTTLNNWRWRLLPQQLNPAAQELIADMVAVSGRDGLQQTTALSAASRGA